MGSITRQLTRTTTPNPNLAANPPLGVERSMSPLRMGVLVNNADPCGMSAGSSRPRGTDVGPVENKINRELGMDCDTAGRLRVPRGRVNAPVAPRLAAPLRRVRRPEDGVGAARRLSRPEPARGRHSAGGVAERRHVRDERARRPRDGRVVDGAAAPLLLLRAVAPSYGVLKL